MLHQIHLLEKTGSQPRGEAANGDGGGEYAAVQVAVGGSGNLPRASAGKVDEAEGPHRFTDEPGILSSVVWKCLWSPNCFNSYPFNVAILLGQVSQKLLCKFWIINLFYKNDKSRT